MSLTNLLLRLRAPVDEPEVNHALFLLGYRNLRSSGFGQIVLAFLVTLASYEYAHALTLGIWLGYSILAGLFYFVLLWHFKLSAHLQKPDRRITRRWLRYRRALQLFSSIGWGATSFLMAPQAAAHNAFILIVFTGIVGHSAFANLANDFLGSMVSAGVTMLIFVAYLPQIYGENILAIVLEYGIYALALLVAMHHTQALLRNAIRLRLANEELARNNAEQARRADQANRDKSEFLAAASHDLRQPVHALLLLVEAYRQQVPAAMNHPLMQHITQAGQSINGLFNALMELSRLESGSEKPTLSEFDLPEALQGVLARSQPEAQAKGLHLRSFLAPGLGRMRVCTDQVLLKRIVANLLSNALRYTPRGGVLLALRRCHGAAGGLWIEVWDTGIGIAQADQSRIFDPYVQMANRERDRSKGLGLGLAIVRHACELLGLTVSVHSVPGRGTRFRLELPSRLIVAHPKSQVLLHSAQTKSDGVVQAGVWLRGRRVLLVEDDPLVQLAMQALLSSWQLDVRSATRGDASALEVCAPNWVPECVLCDFRLPGSMNGIELLDFLQQEFPTAIGVLITGEMLPTVQQAAEDAGYMLISKPVDAAVLAYTLGALLERRNEERNP